MNRFFVAALSSLVLPGAVFAATIAGSRVTEDFTTLEYADLTSLASSAATTGVWDVPRGRARAHAFANGDASRPIDFGNGADGVVNRSTGYAFDTDSHPNGYDFASLTITGGTITVTGRNALVIRSLGAISITPALSVSGPDANDGLASGATVPGPLAITCAADGGAGGAATATTASNGGDGVQSDGTPEGFGFEGQGEVGGPNNATIHGQGSFGAAASDDYDNPANFICGSSGPGGGGRSNGGANIASGGAGGAGGGRMRLVAVDDINVNSVLARGGNGGDGLIAGTGPECSGYGSGGNGGAIWIQTLGNIVTGSPPDVSGGNSGTACLASNGPALITGWTRGDTATAAGHPGWASPGSFFTETVPASVTSVVQSKAYPLGVLNAGFSAPSFTAGGGGTVTVEYAGSRDGVSFDAYTTDLPSLSDKNYRFVRWRATFNTGGGGATPTLTRVEIPYEERGLTTVDLKLAAGCASVASIAGSGGENGPRPRAPGSDAAGALMTVAAITMLRWLSRPRNRAKLGA